MDVARRASRRRARNRRAARPGRSPGRARDDLAGRDPQLVDPGLSRQARCPARALYDPVVHGQPPGEYHLFCTQYCGASHSHMVGRVVVMEPTAFEGWLSAHASAPTMAARGAQRYRELGCNGCHGAQAAVRAPKLEGLFGRSVELRDGRSVLADERFIRDAVLLPNRDVPAGYDASMPSFRGQIGEEELLEIIEYLKSLGNATQQVVP